MKRRTLSKDEERKIRQFVFKEMEGSDLAHKFDHVECVVRLCLKIAKKEKKCNMRILLPAAYFHDCVSREKATQCEKFREESAKKAELFLRCLNFKENEIDKIVETIVSSGYEAKEKGIQPKTLEAKILHDADLLEAMGARGIAREFAFCGWYKSPIMGDPMELDPEKPVKLQIHLTKIDPPIRHFYSKLLWLKDEMFTETGRKIAQGRHKFMVKFLKRYRAEYLGIK